MSKYPIELTIITPTYNRAYTLEKLYRSLLAQPNLTFEWVVVDDGSTDNTEMLVQNFKKENLSFPIYYYKQENGGKHRAVNLGVEKAHGEFCFIVDSDDYLAGDAVAKIHNWLRDIRYKSNYAGVAGLKGNGKAKTRIGGFPPWRQKKGYVDAKNNHRRKMLLLGDKAEIYRTDLLKEYPFFEFQGENFLSEVTVWDEIAYRGYKIRWYDDIIYWCEYLEDGLTRQSNRKEIQNFQGFTYYSKQRIKCHGVLEKAMAVGYFVHISQLKGISSEDAARLLDMSTYKAKICHFIWKQKNKFKDIC